MISSPLSSLRTAPLAARMFYQYRAIRRFLLSASHRKPVVDTNTYVYRLNTSHANTLQPAPPCIGLYTHPLPTGRATRTLRRLLGRRGTIKYPPSPALSQNKSDNNTKRRGLTDSMFARFCPSTCRETKAATTHINEPNTNEVNKPIRGK